jgi:hypothetical protein
VPAPTPGVEASPEHQPRLRPVPLALWLVSVACFVVLLLLR